MRSRPRLVLLLAAFSVAAACSYYDSSLLAPRGDEDQTTGGNDGDDGDDASPAGGQGGMMSIAGGAGGNATAGAGGAGGSGDDLGGSGGTAGAAGAAVTGCTHAEPPLPPITTDEGGDGVGDSGDFVLGLKTLDLHAGTAADFGYDLDDRCSCPDMDFGCVAPPGQMPVCDGMNGIDNQADRITAFLSLAGYDQNGLQGKLDSGGWNVLLRVRGYNGEANDPNVEVDWYVAAKFDQHGDGSVPKFDGTDAFPVSTVSLDPKMPTIDNPILKDKNAYVSNHVLVCSLRSGDAPLQISPDISIVLESTFITGTLTQDPSSMRWSLGEGVLAGEWKTQSLLAELGHVTTGGEPICTGSPFYENVKNIICSSADIYAGATAPVPTDHCNAISLALGVEMVTVTILYPVPLTVDPTKCTPDTDPANDACDGQ